MIVSARRLVPATLLILLASLLLAVPAQAAETGSISGTVTARPASGAAAPYADATVYLDRISASGNENALGSARPDSSGRFTVGSLPDGAYLIRTYPDERGDLGDYGYEYYDDQWGAHNVTQVDIAGGQAVTLAHTIELRPIGRIVGRVLDEQGNPVQGTVNFRQGDGGGHGVRTDAQGRYDSLVGTNPANLIPGSYTLSFNLVDYSIGAPAYDEVDLPATVTAGGTTTVDITLERRPTATFTVLDSAGAPVADAPLAIEMRDPRYHGGQWGPILSGPHATDARGRYRFSEGLAAVRFRVGLPEGYTGSDVGEYWADAYSAETAQVLSFPAGVALDRQFTVQLGPAPVVAPVVAPVSPPTVAGKARSGRPLTARVGTWAPAGVSLGYQWLADGVPIARATRSTYTPTNAVAGKRLSVRVTGSLAGAAPVVATSAATAPVTGVLRVVRPRVAGIPRLRKKLTVAVRSWSPAPVQLTFQWLRDGKRVKGRTARGYRLTKADLGHRISVRVSGRKTSYVVATATSRATAKVRR